MGITLLASVCLMPGQRASGQTASGAAVSGATVTEILDSNQVYIQNRSAQVNSVAQARQQVRTQAARASLRFNTGAVARLAHNSSLVVGQCAQLNRGTLLVNGSLNGCSTSTLAGVRGTIYTLEVTETGETIVRVFEGEVTVQRYTPTDPVNFIDPMVDPVDPLVPFIIPPGLDPGGPQGPDPGGPGPANPDPGGPGGPPPTGPFTDPGFGQWPGPQLRPSLVAQSVGAAPKQEAEPTDSADETVIDLTEEEGVAVVEGQQVVIDAAGREAVVAPLSAEDFIALLEGPLIRGFAVEIPGIGNLRRSFQRLFPGIPLPTYWVPRVPIPPVRFPFPF